VNEELTALAQRLREALTDLERLVDRAEQLRKKAVRTGDDDYWDGVALNLHGFYAGVENIFEDIAQVMDDSIPSGADWHRRLLNQMAEAMPDIRPSVIDEETGNCLVEYLGFRHVVRHIYTFNLRPARLQELVDGLRVCWQKVARDLNNFIDFLDRVAQSDTSE
jgi:hypothetical protein